MIEIIYKLIICHLIGDYVLQNDFIAKTKGENWMDSLMEKFIRKSMRQGRKCPYQTGRWLNGKGELDSIRNRYV